MYIYIYIYIGALPGARALRSARAPDPRGPPLVI